MERKEEEVKKKKVKGQQSCVEVVRRGNAHKPTHHHFSPEDRNRLHVLSLSSDALVSLVEVGKCSRGES